MIGVLGISPENLTIEEFVSERLAGGHTFRASFFFVPVIVWKPSVTSESEPI